MPAPWRRRWGCGASLLPPQASVLSALGMLLAPAVREGARTLLHPLRGLAPTTVQGVLSGLQEQARSLFAAEGIEEVAWQAALECRYIGQSYELAVPMPLPLSAETLAALPNAFHAAHEQRYGTRYPQEIELVTVRLRGEAAPTLGDGWRTPQPVETHKATPSGERDGLVHPRRRRSPFPPSSARSLPPARGCVAPPSSSSPTPPS